MIVGTQQARAPVRNASVAGASVYTHSGEFSPRVVDFLIPGRGLSFEFVRKYRSANRDTVGPLGRGWTFHYARRVVPEDRDVLYFDGVGRVHRFEGTGKNAFASPRGFYSKLKVERGETILTERHGTRHVFETPENGGRLLSIEDRNGNRLQFQYRKAAIQVTDPLGRQITIATRDGRVTAVEDHGGRTWRYLYDDSDCLIEIVQPPTAAFQEGPRIRYGYDDQRRLVVITNPNGETFLQNNYDKKDRIIEQVHGSGTYRFAYREIQKSSSGHPVYHTEVLGKNGAKHVLTHDEKGHVTESTLYVSAKSLSPEDRGRPARRLIPLTTKAEFNTHGELVKRVHRAGNTTHWEYDEKNENPLERGNLLRRARRPVDGEENEQNELVMTYRYDGNFQRPTAITNPLRQTIEFEYDRRGNLTRKVYPQVTVQTIDKRRGSDARAVKRQLVHTFEFNAAGQLIRKTDARGSTTEYFYYPESDVTGAAGENSHNDPAERGGYVGRVVRGTSESGQDDAKLTAEFTYDEFGNMNRVLDGRGNATEFEHDAHNRVVRVTSRKPFRYSREYRYDANGNLIETRTAFDRHRYDPAQEEVATVSATVRQTREYDNLNRLVRRSLIGESGQRITETFVRDANENIIRKIQPLGSVTEYIFDERNLLLERRRGVGTSEETATHYTYTRAGRRRSRTNGRDATIRYEYDGFQRYRGFTNEGATSKRQWRDSVGNVVRLEVSGELAGLGKRNNAAESRKSKKVVLVETQFSYDELNRPVLARRAWRDPATGEPLGESGWDGSEGVTTAVIQYGDNHLPVRTWHEGGRVTEFRYDRANRLISAVGAIGDSVHLEYDENSNLIRIDRLGPRAAQEEERFQETIVHEFDELDRLVIRSVNGDPTGRFEYNALGAVTNYRSPSDHETRFLHDKFGRSAGRYRVAMREAERDGGGQAQPLLTRVERDANNRVIARTDAAGLRTRYIYDGLSRRSGVIYPDGTTKHVVRDPAGNVVRVIDPRRTVVDHTYDALNRRVRSRFTPKGAAGTVEHFKYDGLNRLVRTEVNGVSLTRTFDTLSRLLQENQNGQVVSYNYDSAGNRVTLRYSSGHEVRKTYDALKRVEKIRDGQNTLVARYEYRSSGQLLRQDIGGVAEASYRYSACQGCLTEIAYRRKEADAGGKAEILVGSRYHYDLEQNPVWEEHLERGDIGGDRYFHDSANRLVAVQYGVRDLDDPESPFKRGERFDLSPVGTVTERRLNDNGRKAVEKAHTNRRHAYRVFGDRRFQYDENGNRIAVIDDGGEGDCAEKRYSYDYANRLVRVECLDMDGKVTRTVEYVYDSFNRQVKRTVKDEGGEKKETVRVWSGRRMIEEWEDGRLARTYVHGTRANEVVQMSSYANGVAEKLFYAVNARGLVRGLIDASGNVIERFDFDVFGQPTLVDRVAGSSPIEHPFLAGASLWDADAGVFFGVGGGVYDPTTGQLLNPGESAEGGACSQESAGEQLPPVGQGGKAGLMQSNGGGATYGPGNPEPGLESESWTATVVGAAAGAAVGGVAGGVAGGLFGKAFVQGAKQAAKAVAKGIVKAVEGLFGGEEEGEGGGGEGGGNGGGGCGAGGGAQSSMQSSENGDGGGSGGGGDGGDGGGDGGDGGADGGDSGGDGENGDDGGNDGDSGGDGEDGDGGDGGCGGGGSASASMSTTVDGEMGGTGSYGGVGPGGGRPVLGGDSFAIGGSGLGGTGLAAGSLGPSAGAGNECGGGNGGLGGGGISGIGSTLGRLFQGFAGGGGSGSSLGGCSGSSSGLGNPGVPGFDNSSTCGGGLPGSYVGTIGGTNIGGGFGGGDIDPLPMATIGMMAGAGGGFGEMGGEMDGVGGLAGGIFCGYDCDPHPDDAGMGMGGYTTPQPEVSGGSCGTGSSSNKPSPDCMMY